jgi:hypothetical protein
MRIDEVYRHPREKVQRNQEMVQRRLEGQTWRGIAVEFGINERMVRRAVKTEARKSNVRLPSAGQLMGSRQVGKVPFSYVEAFVAAEKQLWRSGATATNAVQLNVPRFPGDGPGAGVDNERWRFVTRCLLERGWKIAVDRERSELWFFAPEEETEDS